MTKSNVFLWQSLTFSLTKSNVFLWQSLAFLWQRIFAKNVGACIPYVQSSTPTFLYFDLYYNTAYATHKFGLFGSIITSLLMKVPHLMKPVICLHLVSTVYQLSFVFQLIGFILFFAPFLSGRNLVRIL